MHRWRLPILVAALSTIGPFSIDTYLPAFGDLGRALGATPIEVQQSLTAYLVPFAWMNLWHGAVSDRAGRRRVVLVALAVFGVASVGCAAAGTIRELWAFRMIQGLASGVGLVVGRAIVRDVYQGAEAQRVLSWVAVLYLIAPAVAPVLGGWLEVRWGWRSIFGFLAVFAVVLWGSAWAGLPETLPVAARQPFRPGYLVRAYVRTLFHGRFLAVAIAGALNFGALFLYIASAPVFVVRDLGLKETQFLALFGPTTLGMMMGGAWSGKWAGRVSRDRTVGIGYALMLAAAVGNVGLHAAWRPQLPWTLVPLWMHALGMSLAMPSLTLWGLDLFPDRKGLAASCQAFVLTGGNSIVAGALSPWAQGSAARLAWVSASCTMAGLAGWLTFRWRSGGEGGGTRKQRSDEAEGRGKTGGAV